MAKDNFSTAGVVGGLLALCVLFASPILLALAGPIANFENPNVACGSALLDGGWDGSVQDDGGYESDQIVSANDGFASVRLENNTATPVYLGGAGVQPGDNVLAICTNTATCASPAISIDARSGELYCSATASTTVRALAGGF